MKSVCAILVAGLVVAAGGQAVRADKPAVVPVPVKMTVGEGSFTIGPDTKILVAKETLGEGEYLRDLLAVPTGLQLAVTESATPEEAPNCITLRAGLDRKDLGEEGYTLKVLADRIVIDAPQTVGVFHGIQTIRQLLPAKIESKSKVDGVAWTVPVVTVEDYPRFSWRGLMLDDGRSYHGPAMIKQYLDLLALYKMSRFHWHLTEAVGWRIEIKKYPKFTEGYQKKTGPDGNPNPILGHFYTQDEIREIVAYAKARHIMVVPEIETFPHSTMAVQIYPEQLACQDQEKNGIPGYLQNRVVCAGSDGAFEILDGVLGEVAELFPSSPWIHVGGDEPLMQSWAGCPRCKARMQAENLKDVHGLYNYFVKRLEGILEKKGKRLHGWEEVARAGLKPGGTAQIWHGPEHGATLANQGIDVVMSPGYPYYLDTPLAGRRSVSAQAVLEFEPMPAGLKPEMAKHFLGVESPMWCDRLRNFSQYHMTPQARVYVDTQVLPRLLALAESGWSTKESKKWEDFRERMQPQGERLGLLGFQYYRDPTIWSADGK